MKRALIVALVVVLGCGENKKEEGKATGTGAASASASGSGSASASGTGSAAASGSGSGSASASAAAPTCAAACEHRRHCGVAGDVAACVKDCDALSELLGASAPKELAAYVAADCAAVTKGEEGFVQATACIRGCKHVLECGVVGTSQGCFVECATNLQKQAYTVADLDKIAVADCETVKKTVTLTPPGGGAPSEADELFKRNPRFPMCNDHSDCGGAYPVCCRQQFHSSCVSACY